MIFFMPGATRPAGGGHPPSAGRPPGAVPQRHSQVPVVAPATCAHTYPFFEAGSMLCAGYERVGVDACTGDSGGRRRGPGGDAAARPADPRDRAPTTAVSRWTARPTVSSGADGRRYGESSSRRAIPACAGV
ncbi:trypsin-like serine protease [Streptomyces sp. NPDC006670]|uniref:trypsin-like serine protease n=1 Tax=Streptomyces sp. NPDC006670 TaxID=3154476 RepID=UPI0034111C0D